MGLWSVIGRLFASRSSARLEPPTPEQLENVRRTYLEVLKDEGGTANPNDYESTLEFVPSSAPWPPNKGTALCGCCAVLFSFHPERHGAWVSAGRKDPRPVPLCAFCVEFLNHGARERGAPAPYLLSADYDALGQDFARAHPGEDPRKAACVRIALYRSRAATVRQ